MTRRSHWLCNPTLIIARYRPTDIAIGGIKRGMAQSTRTVIRVQGLRTERDAVPIAKMVATRAATLESRMETDHALVQTGAVRALIYHLAVSPWGGKLRLGLSEIELRKTGIRGVSASARSSSVRIGEEERRGERGSAANPLTAESRSNCRTYNATHGEQATTMTEARAVAPGQSSSRLTLCSSKPATVRPASPPSILGVM